MLGFALSIVALLALSAFFSGSEMSYASANELRLRNAAQQGGRRQRLAFWIYEHYDMALTTVLVGNNLVNTAATSLATVMVLTLLGEGYAWVATVLMTLLLLIFGEIVPKVVAKEIPERFATAVSLPLRALMWITHPLARLVNAIVRGLSSLWKGRITTGPAVTEEDLEILFDTAEDEGSLAENTSELLQSALDFDDRMAYEILTPRVDMLAIDVDDPMERIIATAVSSHYSRLPVYEGDKDNVIGVLHVTRFLKQIIDAPPPEDLRPLLMPTCYVAHTALLPAVLSAMRQQKCHLVVICDEYGGTQGILTMEDVLEELVGDIWDETDEIRGELTLLPDGQWEASGDLHMHDLLESLALDERDFPFESSTLGGWAKEMLGATAQPGDMFAYQNLRVTIQSVRKHRVVKALIGIEQKEPDAAQKEKQA